MSDVTAIDPYTRIDFILVQLSGDIQRHLKRLGGYTETVTPSVLTLRSFS